VRVWTEDGKAPAWCYATAGLFAALTAAIELPAASFAVALLVVLLWRWPARTLAFFVPAAAVAVVAFFVTNHLAIGQWMPAYGEFGGPWYEYEGSVWKANPNKEPRGIDWAGTKEGRAAYAFHFLLGHHGVITLSPIVLLALAGMVRGVRQWLMALRAPPPEPAPETKLDPVVEQETEPTQSTEEPAPATVQRSPLPELAALTLALTVVVIGFYLVKTTNYGGWTNGPRWAFWLTPLWLLSMLPVVDRLAACRWGRAFALFLLAVSAFSAFYRNWNPWRHPWMYQLLDWQGWIPY
jgi:hypothetical protein